MRAAAMHSATRALCNACGEIVDAKIELLDNRVYLTKSCLTHGITRALISSDAEWYLRSLAYVKPGTRPRERAPGTGDKPCPASCGLCPNHMQHTCVPIVEITSRCDLKCPICLVPDTATPFDLSVAQTEQIIDHLLAYEGSLNMLNLSGGEPTRHPAFLDIVDCCLRDEIGIVSVSTNGLRLMQEEDLIQALRDRSVVISLQYDGASEAVWQKLRGRADLATKKRKLIDRILGLGARMSLTMTLGRNINEAELAGVLDLFLQHDEIVSMMIQPLAHTRYTSDPEDVITIPDVVRLLAAGSNGVLGESDFSPLPCSHPTCFALTYLLKTIQGDLVPLPQVVDCDNYLDIIKNQALLGTDMETLQRVKDAMYSLWSADGLMPAREPVLRTVKQILLDLNELGADASHRDMLELGTQNVKSIFIHHFMDRYAFDLSRVMKCCNHYPQTDGRLLPACVRNNLMGG